MKKYFSYRTAIGPVTLAECGGNLTHLFFGDTIPSGDDFIREQTPVLILAARQLEQYLAGERRSFDVPMEPAGSDFERKVWKALGDIPYGQTRTYGDVAAKIGNPRSSRAVGRANNRNPLAVFIPCHRVVGAGGKLVGYAGGLQLKARLLKLENPTLF